MQKAIFVTEIGKPLSLGTRAIPTPGPNEVLIRVTAAQLLPHDTYGRDSGLFFGTHLPFIPGTNISGIVTKYKTDEHIFGEGNPLAASPDSTGLQEYALLDTRYSARVPEGFSDEEMATLPVNAVTSFAALFGQSYARFEAPFQGRNRDHGYGDRKIVVIGAGSQVGKLAIQFARMVGIGEIVAVASLSRTEELRKLGATKIVDRYEADLARVLREEKASLIYDCVNWTYELAVEAVSDSDGALVLTLHNASEAVKLLEEKGKKNAKVKMVVGLREAVTEEFWGNLGSWVTSGELKIPEFRAIEGLDVEKVEECLDSYRDGGPVVQAVVRPGGKKA